jgi:trimethylamine--corrinoid protein Co-methyltransferase
VAQAKRGVSVGLTAMPVAGITTPVTVEGFIAMASAEVVAGWIAGRAINPEVPLGGSMWAATVDMRTGQPSYSAPDAMYMAFVCCEFLRRWTGYPFPPGSGEYCDSTQPGLYAMLEKEYKAMMVAAFTGHHPGLGQGMLECGKTLAPVQLLLERDFSSALGLCGHEVAPTPENLGLPTMLEVDLGLSTNYLQSDHTFRHFRANAWLPQLLSRAGWTGAADEEVLLNRAQAQFEALLAQYQKPEGREEKLAALGAVLKRAAKDYGVALAG